MVESEEAEDLGYAVKVGSRLRAIRKQKRLSLQEVEATSTQEFKASVLGAYERGERAISVPRLQRLARFYNVPVDQLLPRDDADLGPDSVIDLERGAVLAARSNDDGPVTIDLVRQVIAEETARLRADFGPDHYAAGHYADAAVLFESLVTNPEFVEFLTLPGYELLA